MLVQNQNFSPETVDPQKAQYLETMVPDNNKAPPLVSVNSIKSYGTWTLKHEIRL